MENVDEKQAGLIMFTSDHGEYKILVGFHVEDQAKIQVHLLFSYLVG